MSVTTVPASAAPAAIASAVPAASRVLLLGTEGPAATTRARSIRVAAGVELFKDVADLRLFGAAAEPAIVRALAARVVAEQVVAPSLVITEHAAFAGIAGTELAALFLGASVLRISG